MNWMRAMIASFRLLAFEEVESSRKSRVSRIKTSVLLTIGTWSAVGGVVMIFAGMPRVGLTLLLTVAPFLYLYPAVRAVFFGGKDGWASTLTTFILEELLKSELGKIFVNRDRRK